MSLEVTVIDYGSSNLHSVIKGLRQVGAAVDVTDRPEDIRRAERLVLPGVGAFSDGMGGLERLHLVSALHEYFAAGRPFLGICLGMQMLFSESEEFGLWSGLGAIPGRVKAIPHRPGYKVPHTGWSKIHPMSGSTWQGSILASTPPGMCAYFVHSLTAVPESEEDRLADTDYGGVRISAAVRRGNITGCQFHPEKSGPLGLDILRCFCKQ